jgi:hypothetical protein
MEIIMVLVAALVIGVLIKILVPLLKYLIIPGLFILIAIVGMMAAAGF